MSGCAHKDTTLKHTAKQLKYKPMTIAPLSEYTKTSEDYAREEELKKEMEREESLSDFEKYIRYRDQALRK